MAAPISSFGPHFDLVQSCALAVPEIADNAATQHNTSVLRINSPPDVFCRCLASFMVSRWPVTHPNVEEARASKLFEVLRCDGSTQRGSIQTRWICDEFRGVERWRSVMPR
ncbi:hypothetical protein [Bradyrhizobium yuanmingense]|uniref:hypothetical protein n=1 Tax=Bradyrhizobium yuanmingense TaxID=108015 RepID=UPI0035141BA6